MSQNEPIQICPDTWVITQLEAMPPLGSLFLNSAVIRSSEPIVIDAGTPLNRVRWLDQLGSIVEPGDVRWIFLSHDDVDHVGNLPVLLELCPRATVLTSWLAMVRMRAAQGITLPVDRVRYINDGDAVDVGDRVLHAVLPPVFDNPTTRGLFDPTNGFYWGADCFAAPVPEFIVEADDVSAEHWCRGFLSMARILSPWHTVFDHARFSRTINRVQQLPIVVAAGAHGPVLRNSRLADAFRMLRELPHIGALQPYSEADLQSWLAAASIRFAANPSVTS